MISIQKADTLNPNSYNILYILQTNGHTTSLRCSASLINDKAPEYQSLKHVFINGFDQGIFRVAPPYGFFQEFNLMLYENIEGKVFMHELDDNLQKLINKVKLAGQAIRKIHNIPKPKFNIWNPDWYYDKAAIFRYYPGLADSLDKIKGIVWQRIEEKETQKVFCHGDYQPNNMIFHKREMYIMDFGSACILYKEIDIASFIIQLKSMLTRFGNISNFEILKEKFFEGYGEFDKEKFSLFSVLFSLRLLNTFIEYFYKDDDDKIIPSGYNLVKESLEASKIKI